jgi:predicted dehydrogenase
MSETIRVGIIGVGQIGKHHISSYQSIPGAQIVAVADVNEAEARRVAEAHKIPHVYTDFHELVNRDDIQAVDVCLHNNFHAPVTIAALKAGKHVYCEKPMAGTYRDAEQMYQTAQQTGQKLCIQLSTLFSAETKAAKTLIDAGELGHIYHARSSGYRRRGRPFVDGYGTPTFVQKQHSGGGALYDMGVYHITTMLYLLNNPTVLRISGKTYQETDMDDRRRKLSGFNVEELGLGFVRFEGGLTLDIIEAWAVHMNPFEGSSIFGSKGGIRLEPFGFYRNLADLELNATVDLGNFDWRQHTVSEIGDVFDSPQHHWIAALQNRVELLPIAALALNTMLISEGIYLSDRLGKEVTAEEVKAQSVSTAHHL